MARPREGFKPRLVELPLEVWGGLDALAESSGVPYSVLLEDAVRRYTAKPPAKLPEARKKGRPKKVANDDAGG
jgi:hypothetical protein